MAKKRDIYLMSNGLPVTEGSVSELCGVLDKPALVPWAAKKTVEAVAEFWKPGMPYEKAYIEMALRECKNAHRRHKDTAGDIGTRVHLIVGAYVEGQLLPEHVKDPDERRGLENFIKTTADLEWLGSEITLINEWCECPGETKCADLSKCPNLRGYGGTADGFARHKKTGMYLLPDFKTSNYVQATYSMQCTLYAEAKPVGDHSHLRDLWKLIEEARILHFDKDLLTWESLERNIKEHKPFIPHFIGCRRWKKRFETNSFSTYEKKSQEVEVTKDSISFASSAPPVVQARPPQAVWMG